MPADPGCDPVDNGCLLEEAWVSSSFGVDELDSSATLFDNALSVIVFAFVDHWSPGSIRFSDTAMSTLTKCASRTATGAARVKLKAEWIRRIQGAILYRRIFVGYVR